VGVKWLDDSRGEEGDGKFDFLEGEGGFGGGFQGGEQAPDDFRERGVSLFAKTGRGARVWLEDGGVHGVECGGVVGFCQLILADGHGGGEAGVDAAGVGDAVGCSAGGAQPVEEGSRWDLGAGGEFPHGDSFLGAGGLDEDLPRGVRLGVFGAVLVCGGIGSVVPDSVSWFWWHDREGLGACVSLVSVGGGH
jgi:hypothetical protein